MSLTKRMNSRGPRQEPCAAPYVTSYVFDLTIEFSAVFNLFDTFGSAALPIGTHLNYHWERCAPINTTLTSEHLVIQNGFVSQHMK